MFVSLIGVFAALLSLVVVALCAVGVIPPNRIVGLRTNTTLRSQASWRSVHRRAVVPLAVTAAAVIGCWLLYPAGLVNSSSSAALGLCVLVAGLLWGWVRGTRG